jgi:LPXTG-site transpeptidase (sortase) family protein
MLCASCRRSLKSAGRKGHALLGLLTALAGGLLLAVAAAQWIEGVVAQSLAGSSYRTTVPAAPRAREGAAETARLPELPLQGWTWTAPPPPSEPAPEIGDVVGRVRIPSVGLDLAVFEGVSSDILRKGPGHVPGTGLPTLGSNCVITAHRDSFFRPLASAKVGDAVFLTGDGGEREYRLTRSRVVSPKDVGVLAPTDDEQVTLVTCYPFRWIGPAPYRIVWQALPVAAFAQRAEGLPSVESR